MGAVLRMLKRDLAIRSLTLRYGAYVDMPSNDVTLFSVKPEQDNLRKLEAAKSRISRITADITEGRRHIDLEPSAFWGRVREQAYRARIRVSHEHFFADSSCSRCGLCEQLCPLGSIEMIDGRPSWKPGFCQECEACINFCPKKAIQYRGSKTESKRRYTHPAVNWKDIASQHD